jgi:hypothetical protein
MRGQQAVQAAFIVTTVCHFRALAFIHLAQILTCIWPFQARQYGQVRREVSMVARTSALLAFVICCSIGNAKEIPLNEIWAFGMPGTRDIRELEANYSSKNSLISEIRKRHTFKTWQDKAGPGFAVEGIDLEALKNAHAVITGAAKRSSSLGSGKEISLVFFSLEFGYYVHLTDVDIIGNDIEIRYEFVPHLTKNRTRHFALIPVGKLAKGNFSVSIIPEPFERRNVGKEFKEIPDERKLPLVSSTFEFTVQ